MITNTMLKDMFTELKKDGERLGWHMYMCNQVKAEPKRFGFEAARFVEVREYVDNVLGHLSYQWVVSRGWEQKLLDEGYDFLSYHPRIKIVGSPIDTILFYFPDGDRPTREAELRQDLYRFWMQELEIEL